MHFSIVYGAPEYLCKKVKNKILPVGSPEMYSEYSEYVCTRSTRVLRYKRYVYGVHHDHKNTYSEYHTRSRSTTLTEYMYTNAKEMMLLLIWDAND
jgi:hypothetical protein